MANLLTDRPIDDPTGPSIINRLLDRVDNRVPVLAAGGILTPDQAKQTLDTGLSMVAIGRGLIINPDWVDSLREGQEIVVELDPTKVKALNIPEKLWTIIQNMPGWIPLKQ
ncbi:HisA/HisF-related TIM barrel protein [Acinetobacter calcoaceticus]|uniref:HisA/HisF-related TIM barrel protein n=1 Tax=Acinetobacter calcoaceticus TaxID=471 RepID=UPI001D0DB675|nr:HisA/HisF-related TIM barrel protein [Acinetobacter calcoaceticus]